MAKVNVNGCVVHKGYLDLKAQQSLVTDVRNIVAAAPLFSPVTPFLATQ